MISLRNTCMACLLGAASLVGTSTWAQTGPSIKSFTVQQVPELVPGTELVFKLNGTPGGKASLTLDGSNNTVALDETRAGNYEGAYTLNTRDKVHHSSQVRATLQVAGRDTQAVLGQTLLTSTAHQAAVAAATPTPVIDFFNTGADAFTGGNDITFTLKGTPGAQVALTLGGTDARIALSEKRSGEYSGSYTIRTRDRITASSVAKATLTLGNKTQTVSKALSAHAVQPTLAARQSCDSCGVVQAIQVVEVQGEPGYTGAIAGGVAGAVLGSQVGEGTGKKAAQILGALGGAYAGREIEKRVKKEQRYDVVVRLHNGTEQTVRMETQSNLQVGKQVKIVDGAVIAND